MRRLLTTILVIATLGPVSGARADTLCTMGSPTPGFKAIRLALPQGSNYIGIELHGDRAARPVEDGNSWHFARGIMILDSNFGLVTYRISNSGSSPKTYHFDNDGQVTSQDAPGVDGPFVHNASSLVPRLSPGVYYAVGFGVDGSKATPNEYWSADVRVQGAVSCSSVAVGQTFDLNHTDASAELQVYAPGLGVAEEGVLPYTSNRQVSIGLLDCSVQFSVEREDQAALGEAECDMQLSNGKSFSVEDAMVPFVTGPGTSTVNFEYSGVAPVISLSGASFDVLV